MRNVWGASLIAVLLTVVAANSADASYCGAARFCRVKPACCAKYTCCKQQCHTVMKTCREVVYERQQQTC